MDRHVGLDLVRITEAAALACSRWMGRGDKNAADQAAVTAMRKSFDNVDIRGTVVIGEGERDEAPMLYIGERVGRTGADRDDVPRVVPRRGSCAFHRGRRKASFPPRPPLWLATEDGRGGSHARAL